MHRKMYVVGWKPNMQSRRERLQMVYYSCGITKQKRARSGLIVYILFCIFMAGSVSEEQRFIFQIPETIRVA